MQTPWRIIMINAASEFFGLLFFVYALTASNNDNFTENVVMGTIILTTIQHSGALYNPVVTLNLVLRRKMDLLQAVILVITQILAVFTASIIAYYVLDLIIQPTFVYDNDVQLAQMFLNELVFTFVLMMFINILSTPETTFTNEKIMIGFIFMFVLHTVRIESINSGSVLNPAMGISLPLAAKILVPGYASANLIWIWILGPCLGGVLAFFVFEYVYYPQAMKQKMIDRLDNGVKNEY